MAISNDKIREIIKLYNEGRSLSQIATVLRIDTSTVDHQVRVITERYGGLDDPNVYALFLPRKKVPCPHPSLRCHLCGLTRDYLHRRERDVIRVLNTKLQRYEAVLLREGYDLDKL